ncbi:hypothetical protein AAMO2058_000677800 [Amorphochlora amoebiformis]
MTECYWAQFLSQNPLDMESILRDVSTSRMDGAYERFFIIQTSLSAEAKNLIFRMPSRKLASALLGFFSVSLQGRLGLDLDGRVLVQAFRVLSFFPTDLISAGGRDRMFSDAVEMACRQCRVLTSADLRDMCCDHRLATWIWSLQRTSDCVSRLQDSLTVAAVTDKKIIFSESLEKLSTPSGVLSVCSCLRNNLFRRREGKQTRTPDPHPDSLSETSDSCIPLSQSGRKTRKRKRKALVSLMPLVTRLLEALSCLVGKGLGLGLGHGGLAVVQVVLEALGEGLHLYEPSRKSLQEFCQDSKKILKESKTTSQNFADSRQSLVCLMHTLLLESRSVLSLTGIREFCEATVAIFASSQDSPQLFNSCILFLSAVLTQSNSNLTRNPNPNPNVKPTRGAYPYEIYQYLGEINPRVLHTLLSALPTLLALSNDTNREESFTLPNIPSSLQYATTKDDILASSLELLNALLDFKLANQTELKDVRRVFSQGRLRGLLAHRCRRIQSAGLHLVSHHYRMLSLSDPSLVLSDALTTIQNAMANVGISPINAAQSFQTLVKECGTKSAHSMCSSPWNIFVMEIRMHDLLLEPQPRFGSQVNARMGLEPLVRFMYAFFHARHTYDPEGKSIPQNFRWTFFRVVHRNLPIVQPEIVFYTTILFSRLLLHPSWKNRPASPEEREEVRSTVVTLIAAAKSFASGRIGALSGLEGAVKELELCLQGKLQSDLLRPDRVATSTN